MPSPVGSSWALGALITNPSLEPQAWGSPKNLAWFELPTGTEEGQHPGDPSKPQGTVGSSKSHSHCEVMSRHVVSFLAPNTQQSRNKGSIARSVSHPYPQALPGGGATQSRPQPEDTSCPLPHAPLPVSSLLHPCIQRVLVTLSRSIPPHPPVSWGPFTLDPCSYY